MRIIGLLLLLAVLLSCTHTTKPDDNDPFSIKLNLTDNSGNPLQGYKVSITQNNFPGIWGIRLSKAEYRPYTTLAYSLSASYKVNLRIYNYFGDPVRTLIDTTQAMGLHQVVWNGLDDNGNSLRDGVYKAEIKYYSGDEVVFSDTCFPYICAEINIDQSPFVTNTLGEVYSEDITPFPGLYCTDTIKKVDECGNEMGNFVFSDTMKVTVESPDHETRIYIFKIINGKNVLNLNWDTMTQVDEKAKKQRTSTAVNPIESMIIEGKLLPPNEFRGNYPNPFN